MFDILKAVQVLQVVGQVIKAGGAAAKELKAAGAKEGVTEADWDALEAQLTSIEDTARREIAAEK